MTHILNELPLIRLRFDLEAVEETEVPAYKGDMLRRALLWWLSEYWCLEPQRCRRGCQHPHECMFGRLCAPHAEEDWPYKLRRMIGDHAPPAYTLWDLRDRRTYLLAGDTWGFELTLVGNLAASQVPAIVAAVQHGAETGMGRQRLRSRLRQVIAWRWAPPKHWEPRILAHERGEQRVLTWQTYQVSDITLNQAHALAWANHWNGPVHWLRIDYRSPIKMKMHGKWMTTPDFNTLLRTLIRRLRLLSVVHGGGEWPHEEWGPLLDLGETVQLKHHETFWTGYRRQSKSSGGHDIEGLIGSAWYYGEDLRPLLPSLWLGQWLHVGKEYVFGSGRYQLQADLPTPCVV